MINILIFSKDRAMQLELLLRSIYEKMELDKFDDEIFVLYKSSNDEYQKGYDKLIEKYGKNMIYFIRETSFIDNIREIFNEQFMSPHTLMLVDDDVFINKNIKGIKEGLRILENDNKICALSLRLNPNINFCQPADLNINAPNFTYLHDKDDTQKLSHQWDWTQCDPRGCWGYPHPVNSNIYHTEYIKALINNTDFSNPCNFEGAINSKRNYNKPYMLCLEKSIIVCIPNNSTGGFTKTSGIDEYSIDNLNRKFLDGYIISTENLYGMDNTACHVILPYEFIREK